MNDTFALIRMQLEWCGQSEVVGALKPYWWGNSYPACCYNFFELLALAGGGDIKTLGVSNCTQAQVLMPKVFASHCL